MGNDYADDGGGLEIYSSLTARARNYVRKRGLFGSIKDLTRRGPFIARGAVGLMIDKRFDRAHGVETSGEIPTSKLDLHGPNSESAVLYDTPPASTLRNVIGSLRLDLSRYTFIDIGSGKGRPMLIASEFPFKKVMGVELSTRLHDVALRNIDAWNSPNQRCHDLEAICADATDMSIPDGPLVLYFFVPFDLDVMQQVIARFVAAYQRSPRDIQVIYLTDPVTHPFRAEALGFDSKWKLVEHKQPRFSLAMRYPLDCHRYQIVATGL